MIQELCEQGEFDMQNKVEHHQLVNEEPIDPRATLLASLQKELEEIRELEEKNSPAARAYFENYLSVA